MANIELEPIDKTIGRLTTESNERVENERKRLGETIRELERNRAVLPLLVGDGILTPYNGMSGSHLWINLGDKPPRGEARKEFLRKLTSLRIHFGAKLELVSKFPTTIDTKKQRVSITLRPAGWKHVEITYTERLPKMVAGKAARCKIVTRVRREKVLVCKGS
jgi:hypothetical protein